MSERVQIHYGMKRVGFGALLLMTVWLQACGPTVSVYRRDISSSTPLTSLKLKVPEGQTKAETNYTVAFVATRYETEMEEVMKSQLGAIKAFNQGMSAPGGGSFAGPYRRMDLAKPRYFDQVKKVLQSDLERILLAKGIRVLGQFPSRDEMTFDDKKRANYAFTPEISITVDTESSSTAGSPYTEAGNIIVSGIITLTLRESITGEKLWVKRIEAVPVSKPYQFVAKHKEPYQYQQSIGIAGMPLQSKAPPEKDDTDQVLADALGEFYAGLGDKLWAHIDSEEWSKYLEQAEKLRQEKRY